MRSPLDGLRVVDFTRALAGPFCSRLFVDAGADVLKVEPPGVGDFTRVIPPKLPSGRSLYFHQQNYGKRSIAIDLRTGQGRDAVLRLIERSDMVIENYRPGVMARLGLGFESLVAVNPALTMVSISGFGQNSSLASLPGQDLAAQARSGLLDLHKTESGYPLVPNTSLTDIVTGAYGFAAALLALLRSKTTRSAVWLDVSIIGAALQLLRGELETVLVDPQTRAPASSTSLVSLPVIPRTVSEVADDLKWRPVGAIRRVDGEGTAEFAVSPIASMCGAHFENRAEELGESTYWALTSIAGLTDPEVLALMASGAVEIVAESLPPEFPATRPRLRMDSMWSPPSGFRPLAVTGTTCAEEIARSILAVQSGQLEGVERGRDTDKLAVRLASARIATPATLELQAQANSGLMDIFGLEDGPPQTLPTPVVSTVAGPLLAAAALLGGMTKGRRPIELDLEQVGLMMHDTALQEALSSPQRSYNGRGGGDRKSLVPYGVYQVADGFLAVSASGGGYSLLMKAIGHPADDPRFAVLEDRVRHRAEFGALLRQWGRRFARTDDAEAALAAAGVVCARVRGLAEVRRDPVLLSDGWLEATDKGMFLPLPYRVLASYPAGIRRGAKKPN